MANDIYSTVTPDLFKKSYARDFSSYFLPTYQEGKTYFLNDEVYYDEQFYTSLEDDNTSLPTDTEKWKTTKDDIYNYITDDDIQKAINQAQLNKNSTFGASDDDKIFIFLHLVAFYLVMDIQNASNGISSSYGGLIASKSVGDVSVSYNFPQWMIASPLYSLYSQNGYGLKYLSLIIPYLSCTILFSPGRTTLG